MNLGFEVTSAKSKKSSTEDGPSTEPMRAGQGIRRNPSTDQKKVRRQIARTASKTAGWEQERDSWFLQVGGGGWMAEDGYTIDLFHSDGEWVAQIHLPDYTEPLVEPGTNTQIKGTDLEEVKQRAERAAASGFQTNASKESTMSFHDADDLSRLEARLLAAMAKASTLQQQQAIALEIEDVKARRAKLVREAREMDLADAIVRDHLTPVVVHEHHTAATDWVGEMDTDVEDPTLAMRTSASIWFTQTHEAVKEDRDEYTEQARGMARRLAGAYGERAEEAAHAFMEHALFLNREAAGPGTHPADTPEGGDHIGAKEDCPICSAGPTAQEREDSDSPEGTAGAPMEASASLGLFRASLDEEFAFEAAGQSGNAESGLPLEPNADMESFDSKQDGWVDYDKADTGQTSEDFPVIQENKDGSNSERNQETHASKTGPGPHKGVVAADKLGETIARLNGIGWATTTRKVAGGYEVTWVFEGAKVAGEDAADVANVPTPGGESGYPQPTGVDGPDDEDKTAARVGPGPQEGDEKCSKCAGKGWTDPGMAWDDAMGPGASMPTCEACKGTGIAKAAVMKMADGSTWVVRGPEGKKVASLVITADNCGSCGAAIERDPAGETNRTWHHADGSKHDHEAVPGGGTEATLKTASRSLSEIAREIRADWKNVYFGAVPYLDAMSEIDSVNDPYYAEDGKTQVIYFLSNAQSWRGETAKRIKAELKSMIGRSATLVTAEEDKTQGWGEEGKHGENVEGWPGHPNSTGDSQDLDELPGVASSKAVDYSFTPHTAAEPIADPSGQAQSGLPQADEDPDEEPMWPWEIGETQGFVTSKAEAFRATVQANLAKTAETTLEKFGPNWRSNYSHGPTQDVEILPRTQGSCYFCGATGTTKTTQHAWHDATDCSRCGGSLGYALGD